MPAVAADLIMVEAAPGDTAGARTGPAVQAEGIRQRHGGDGTAPLPAPRCCPAGWPDPGTGAPGPPQPLAPAAAAAGGAVSPVPGGDPEPSPEHRWELQHLLQHRWTLPGAPMEAGTKLHGLLDAARSWGSRLEQEPQGWVAPSTLSPRRPKTRRWQQRRQEKGHGLTVDAEAGGAPREDVKPPRNAAPGAQAIALALPTMTTVPQEQPLAPQQPGEGRYRPPAPAPSSPACRTGTVLLFPNTSAEHVAVLGPGLHQGLRALSLCTWLASPAPHLGALLSYNTEDGSSKLAMRGHGGNLTSSVHFVIGDRQFRELPVMPLLDGKWHHLCLTWSSSQGQYRFYVDRRLLAAGSGFRQGYEIPAGGSLMLGREQGHPGRDFSAAEAFVGHLAGLALWSRALLPGEVANMATGQRLPRGPLLTLANASLQGGVRRVACPCLQHCL
ncbi:pentraxin-4 isoform X2 [Strix uralensis]|uniref:pentraxin-4 isoform X2 n=1 Tax=Strix uralensis TaxID=36305 RepID=UPI003DA20E51